MTLPRTLGLKMALRLALGLALAAALGGCQSAAGVAPRRAVLSEPHNPLAQQEILRWMEQQSGLARVGLEPGEWAEHSEWVVERRHQYAPDGTLIQGRDIQAPHRFALVLEGAQCVLVHRNTGTRRVLAQARCQAAAP